MSDPITSMALAIGHAIHVGLPAVVVDMYEWDRTYIPPTRIKVADSERRPHMGEVEVYQFPQQWSSTALGFGGIGGQAFTTAPTTIVMDARNNACVYFGDQFAYMVPSAGREFVDDIQNQSMAAVREAGKYMKGRPDAGL